MFIRSGHAHSLGHELSFPLTDLRTRSAYAEGAGIYRILPAGVAIPRHTEELRAIVRCAADPGGGRSSTPVL